MKTGTGRKMNNRQREKVFKLFFDSKESENFCKNDPTDCSARVKKLTDNRAKIN